MPGKRIQIDEETWQQLSLLGHDQMNYRGRIADGARCRRGGRRASPLLRVT
jgi:hypothetical protein